MNVDQRFSKYSLISPQTFTYKQDGTVTSADSMVGLVAPGVVGLAGPGVRPFGKVLAVDDRFNVSVQTSGYMLARYAGPTPVIGVGVAMFLDGNGGVYYDTSVPLDEVSNVDVIDVDEDNSVVVLYLR